MKYKIRKWKEQTFMSLDDGKMWFPVYTWKEIKCGMHDSETTSHERMFYRFFGLDK